MYEYKLHKKSINCSRTLKTNKELHNSRTVGCLVIVAYCSWETWAMTATQWTNSSSAHLLFLWTCNWCFLSLLINNIQFSCKLNSQDNIYLGNWTWRGVSTDSNLPVLSRNWKLFGTGGRTVAQAGEDYSVWLFFGSNRPFIHTAVLHLHSQLLVSEKNPASS